MTSRKGSDWDLYEITEMKPKKPQDHLQQKKEEHKAFESTRRPCSVKWHFTQHRELTGDKIRLPEMKSIFQRATSSDEVVEWDKDVGGVRMELGETRGEEASILTDLEVTHQAKKCHIRARRADPTRSMGWTSLGV